MSITTVAPLFVINKTDTHLLFKNGYIRIEKNGYRQVRPADLEHPDFLDAQERKFIEVSDTEPAHQAVKGGIKPIEFVEPYRGLTADELKAVQANETPKPAATTSAIGRPAPQAVKPEDADAEEKAQKASKKAAAKTE